MFYYPPAIVRQQLLLFLFSYNTIIEVREKSWLMLRNVINGLKNSQIKPWFSYKLVSYSENSLKNTLIVNCIRLELLFSRPLYSSLLFIQPSTQEERKYLHRQFSCFWFFLNTDYRIGLAKERTLLERRIQFDGNKTWLRRKQEIPSLLKERSIFCPNSKLLVHSGEAEFQFRF